MFSLSRLPSFSMQACDWVLVSSMAPVSVVGQVAFLVAPVFSLYTQKESAVPPASSPFTSWAHTVLQVGLYLSSILLVKVLWTLLERVWEAVATISASCFGLTLQLTCGVAELTGPVLASGAASAVPAISRA